MEQYHVTLKGKTPLLLHADDVEWADRMVVWRDDPSNKKGSKAGDDRSPAWRWMGCLYHDGTQVSLSSDMIMKCLMQGGAMVPVPGGKSNKTFKSQTQSGLMTSEAFWPLTAAGGKAVPVKEINTLLNEVDFAKHKALCKTLGFDLFVKRAAVGASKHIRVRPRFREWQATGTIVVIDEQITEKVLRDVISYAGRYKGLGDWRPGGRTPGPHGMFEAEIKKL
jgi:hypothetical protein